VSEQLTRRAEFSRHHLRSYDGERAMEHAIAVFIEVARDF
jgi:hypothetical protein